PGACERPAAAEATSVSSTIRQDRRDGRSKSPRMRRPLHFKWRDLTGLRGQMGRAPRQRPPGREYWRTRSQTSRRQATDSPERWNSVQQDVWAAFGCRVLAHLVEHRGKRGPVRFLLIGVRLEPYVHTGPAEERHFLVRAALGQIHVLGDVDAVAWSIVGHEILA